MGPVGGAGRRDKVIGVVSRRKAAIMAGSAGLGGAFVVGGVSDIDGKGEGSCAMHVSRKGRYPAYHPDSKGKGVVNPVFRVVVFFVFSRNGLTP